MSVPSLVRERASVGVNDTGVCDRPEFGIKAIFLVELFLVAAEEAPAETEVQSEFLVNTPVVLEVWFEVFVAVVVVDEVLRLLVAGDIALRAGRQMHSRC